MQVDTRDKEVEITGIGDFDLSRSFECGQCFRWRRDEDGSYTGVALGHAARIRRQGDSIRISGTASEFETVWRGYFDLDRDYEAIRRSVCIDAFMERASEFGAGIRIFRQEKWEALCSFILSQCNNIPRIRQIIETLCSLFGAPLVFEGRTVHAFPTAAVLADLAVSDLAPLRCGYRAPYLLSAAKAVASGELDLDQLADDPPVEALAAIKSLSGVGEKVASCFVLFGLQKLDAFPVDVWIKKVIDRQYGGTFDPQVFGAYAGIAQQYMFYYARSRGDLDNC